MDDDLDLDALLLDFDRDLGLLNELKEDKVNQKMDSQTLPISITAPISSKIEIRQESTPQYGQDSEIDFGDFEQELELLEQSKNEATATFGVLKATKDTQTPHRSLKKQISRASRAKNRSQNGLTKIQKASRKKTLPILVHQRNKIQTLRTLSRRNSVMCLNRQQRIALLKTRTDLL